MDNGNDMYETYSAHAHFNFITLDAVVTIIYQLFIFMNKQTASWIVMKKGKKRGLAEIKIWIVIKKEEK